MSIVKTTEDGWDCVPELNEVVEILERNSTFQYEIKHCVRVASLDDMVYEMKDILEEAIEKLDQIETDREFKTVEDDE